MEKSSFIFGAMISATPHMTAAELQEALDRLDIEQIELARLLDVTPRAVQKWLKDDATAPGYVSLFVRLLIDQPSLKRKLGVRPKSGRGKPVRPRKVRQAA